MRKCAALSLTLKHTPCVRQTEDELHTISTVSLSDDGSWTVEVATDDGGASCCCIIAHAMVVVVLVRAHGLGDVVGRNSPDTCAAATTTIKFDDFDWTLNAAKLRVRRCEVVFPACVPSHDLRVLPLHLPCRCNAKAMTLTPPCSCWKFCQRASAC